jgi:hypothetical protein
MTLYGWDMSHFDAPSIGNAISEGISFITHKAGGDSPDAELAAWWVGVKDHRDQLLLGAYWVLYPGNPAGRADAFLARLDSQCPGWRDGPFVLQADCEKWNNDPATVPSKAEIQTFCDRLTARMPKLHPIVYAPYWVYTNTLKGLTYPLWASSYVSGSGSFKSLYPGDASSRWAAYSGQVPAVLQYTSSATIGGQTTCDANAFRGSLNELTHLVAPGWSEDMALSSDDKAWIHNEIAAITAQDAPQADGTPASKIGRNVLNQGVPNGLRPADPVHGLEHERSTVWEALEDLGAALASLQTAVAGIQLQQAAGGATPAQVEEAVRNVLHGA